LVMVLIFSQLPGLTGARVGPGKEPLGPHVKTSFKHVWYVRRPWACFASHRGRPFPRQFPPGGPGSQPWQGVMLSPFVHAGPFAARVKVPTHGGIKGPGGGSYGAPLGGRPFEGFGLARLGGGVVVPHG